MRGIKYQILFFWIFIIISAGCMKKDLPEDQAEAVDLNYSYEDGEGNIYLGTQPIAIPTGVIPELMKYDTILHDQLAKSGKTLNILPFLKGQDINTQILQGNIDAAVAGDMPALTLAAEKEVYITSLAKQSYSSIISRSALSLNELKGRRIAFSPGSTSHYSLLQALETAKLKEEDIISVQADVNVMIDLLAEKKIDAFSAWEPIPTMALMKDPQLHTVHRMLSTSFYYFSEKFVTRYPGIVEILIASQIRAISWMKQDKENLMKACYLVLEAGEKLSGKKSNLTTSILSELVIRDLLSLTVDSSIPPSDLLAGGRIHSVFLFLKKEKKINESVSWEEIQQQFRPDFQASVINKKTDLRLNEYKYGF